MKKTAVTLLRSFSPQRGYLTVVMGEPVPTNLKDWFGSIMRACPDLTSYGNKWGV